MVEGENSLLDGRKSRCKGLEEWHVPLKNKLASTRAFSDDVLRRQSGPAWATREADIEGLHGEEQGQERPWHLWAQSTMGTFCSPWEQAVCSGQVPGYLHCWFRPRVHLPGKWQQWKKNSCSWELSTRVLFYRYNFSIWLSPRSRFFIFTLESFQHTLARPVSRAPLQGTVLVGYESHF